MFLGRRLDALVLDIYTIYFILALIKSPKSWGFSKLITSNKRLYLLKEKWGHTEQNFLPTHSQNKKLHFALFSQFLLIFRAIVILEISCFFGGKFKFQKK